MYSMHAIGKFISNFRDFYNEINAATLTGAIDVVVVEQADGSYTCSPFHVRFGKLGVLRSREKIVDIEINGEPQDIHMKLGESGEAFFVEEVSVGNGSDDYVPPHLACSPIPQDYFPPRFTERYIEDTEKVIVEDGQENKDDNISEDHTFVMDDIYSQPDITQIVDYGDAGESLEVSKSEVNEGSAVIQPKTFRAETVIENTDTIEKVRKISLVQAEFRPISADSSVADSALCQKTEEIVVDPQVDNCILGRKDSYKENAAPAEDNLKLSNSNNRRKKRRKSLKKKSGQKKNNGGGGSSSQTEQSEMSEGREAKDQDEISEAVFQDEQVEPPVTCSHLGGVMVASSGTTLYSSNCETCNKGPLKPAITVSTTEQGPAVTLQSENLLLAAANNLAELSRIQHASTETDFHFFSDTELTPGCSPQDSRPGSPVQSDTEYEMNRQSKAVGTEEASGQVHGVMQQSWRWGELPSPPPRSLNVKEKADPEPVSSSDEDVQKQQQEQSEQSREEEDAESAESGNGTSLPQSPNSVEGAVCGPKSLDSDFEEPKHSIFEKKSYGEISLSLCGGLSDSISGPSEDTFLQNLVTFDDLSRDPKVTENPNLVVRFNGKYYNWKTVCPIIMSLVVFQKPLPQEIIDTLCAEYMPLKKGQKKDSKDSKQSSYSSWFSWRRASEPKKIITPAQEGPTTSDADKLEEVKDVPDTAVEPLLEAQEKSNEKPTLTLQNLNIEIVTSEPVDIQTSAFCNTNSESIETETEDQDMLPKEPFAEPSVIPASKETKEEGYSGSNSSDDSDCGHTKSLSVKKPLEKRSYYDHPEKYRKTLRLSSDQIASLNLNEGANEVVFSVTTAYQGTTRCKCHIYRWRFDDKIVISDIDGTITKSDVLGHILPIVGKDWAQSGVAQLFTKIKNNGYKLLYLSARAIGQARVTRDYLKSIKQGDLSLPEGPLLLNPTSLISAFHREVIEKKPEEFKISCLRDIQALFPEDSKPFYAGYGNRINDVWAYRAVGIPIFRIFTINHRGELKHELTQTFQSSYSNMSYIVDQMFPPPPEDTSEDFSHFIYWRDPIPDIELDPLVVSDLSGGSALSESVQKNQKKVTGAA